MKKLLILLVALAAIASVNSCKEDEYAGKCVIEGTTNPRFNNKKIFLVPMIGPQDAAHVDSVEIKDCKFQFVKDTTEVAVIRVDYHFRLGVQDLIVVTEPGHVDVVIDSISDCKGTPQNDTLSKWKASSEEYNHARGRLWPAMRRAKRAGDTITVNRLQAELDSCLRIHKARTRQIAANLEEGPLHDFLVGLFPKSYQKRMPDGSIVTIEDE